MLKSSKSKDLAPGDSRCSERRGFQDDCRVRLWKARLDVTAWLWKSEVGLGIIREKER